MSLGRFVAYCSHPRAAWPRLSKGGRTLLLAAYFAGSYVATLAALMIV